MEKHLFPYSHPKEHALGIARAHLIWMPKRRKPVIVGPVKNRLTQIIKEVAAERGWLIEELELAPAHVHLLVQHSSKHSIHQIAKAIKGRSSNLLRQEFPHLLKLPSLWSRAYFYTTTGNHNPAGTDH